VCGNKLKNKAKEILLQQENFLLAKNGIFQGTHTLPPSEKNHRGKSGLV